MNASEATPSTTPIEFAPRDPQGLRIAIDMGGTFTDIVLETGEGLLIHKAQTTPSDPFEGILDAIHGMASRLGLTSARALLESVTTIIHGTTRATNAILTGTAARTAFITTKGHPDVLLFRMGGRQDPFRHDREYPPPYVPRSLTFEVEERLDYRGEVVRPLSRSSLDSVIHRLVELKVEAVGVCLLWSVANGAHEIAVRDAIHAASPEIQVTLSHELNPVIREYHRASATSIDASLKPLMSSYLVDLRHRLQDSGFRGRLLVASAAGGLTEPERLAAAPIHSIGSGPALAPVAGRHYAAAEGEVTNAVVVDAGGTSFDISVVRNGNIPRTRETWLGERFVGHLTGFPSIDVRTTGSGGGSIASVDSGGLISVGPMSAGSVPGPACYARGGTLPTVTDAAIVLGYLDPDRLRILGIEVDVAAARRALDEHVGRKLGLPTEVAADAVIRVVTEQMVHAVEDVTVEQGLDPRGAVLVSGGGAAGFNIVEIARRLGCRRLIVPGACTALSATGGLMSEIVVEHGAAVYARTDDFAIDRVNATLDELVLRCSKWRAAIGVGEDEAVIEVFAEARYPGQVWELELPVRTTRFTGREDIEGLREDFHRLHEGVFAVSDPDSLVEVIGWRARIRASSGWCGRGGLAPGFESGEQSTREIYLRGEGWKLVPVMGSAAVDSVPGPAILELPGTSVLLAAGTVAARTGAGTILVSLPARRDHPTSAEVLDVR
jgi:N-methylhydantoinase A